MNITTISQVVSDKSDGEIVMAVQAEIKAVYERRDVNAGTDKATTVQNVVLRDSTGEIRCSFWGHSDLTEHKGQTFVFHSNKTTKGIFGMKAKDKADYKDKGKIVREIEVSKSATIQTVDAFQAANGSVSNATSPAPVAGNTSVKQAIICGKSEATYKVVDLDMLANFWEACYMRADAKQKKLSLTDDIKQSMTASLFIQGIKDNLHFKMPVAEVVAQIYVEKPKAEAKVTPPPPQEEDNTDVPF